MENQKKLPLWKKIVEACIWLLPFALIGVMLLVKQFAHDYETIGKYFGFTGVAMAVTGLFLRFITENSYARFLVYGGVMVMSGNSLVLGGGQTTEPIPVEPVQAVTFSEWLRSSILSFATVEQVHRFCVALAVINGALVLFFLVKLILSIKWEDMYGIGLHFQNTIALGMLLALWIYVLCIV